MILKNTSLAENYQKKSFLRLDAVKKVLDVKNSIRVTGTEAPDISSCNKAKLYFEHYMT